MGHSLGMVLKAGQFFFFLCFYVLSDKRGVMSFILVLSLKLFFNNAVAASLPVLMRPTVSVNDNAEFCLHMSGEECAPWAFKGICTSASLSTLKSHCSEEQWPVEKAARLPTLVTRELWGFLTEPWGFHQCSIAHASTVHAPLLLLQLTDVAVPLGSAPPAPPFPVSLYVASLPLVTAAVSGMEPKGAGTAELSAQAYAAVPHTLSNVQHLSWARALLSTWGGRWTCLKLS